MRPLESSSIYGRAFGNRYLLVATSLLLIMLALNYLAERLDDELERAESVQFHLRLAELQSAVTLMQASVVAKGQLAGLEQFIGRNPMDWIKNEAAHYLGERSLDEAALPSGKWIYDAKQGVIAYQPKNTSVARLSSELNMQPVFDSSRLKSYPQWLRFKVVGLKSKDNKTSAQYRVTGIELRLIADRPLP